MLQKAEPTPEVIEGYVTLTQDRLYYKSVGRGDTIVVLHDGPGLDFAYLEPTIADLGTRYRVVFYDQRGGGKSWAQKLTSAWINMDQFVEDVESLRRYLNVPKIILLGHAWGALVAAEYAMKYPDHVQKIVMLNPAPFYARGWQEVDETLASRMKTLAPRLKTMRESEGFTAFQPQAVERYYREFYQAYIFNLENVDKLQFRFTAESAKALRMIDDIFQEALFDKHFNMISTVTSKLQAKTAVIHGDYDPVPERVVRMLVDAIPDAHLVMLKECGHFPNIEQPDALIEALYDVLQPPNRPPKRVRKPVPSEKKKPEDEEEGLEKFLKTMVKGLPKEKWDKILNRKPDDAAKP